MVATTWSADTVRALDLGQRTAPRSSAVNRAKGPDMEARILVVY